MYNDAAHGFRNIVRRRDEEGRVAVRFELRQASTEPPRQRARLNASNGVRSCSSCSSSLIANYRKEMEKMLLLKVLFPKYAGGIVGTIFNVI